MTPEHRFILDAIENTLNRDPSLRFGQALFNLDINQFVNSEHPEKGDYHFRDNHGDLDNAIIKRVQKRQDYFERQK